MRLIPFPTLLQHDPHSGMLASCALERGVKVSPSTASYGTAFTYSKVHHADSDLSLYSLAVISSGTHCQALGGQKQEITHGRAYEWSLNNMDVSFMNLKTESDHGEGLLRKTYR